jgi:hypothetical protein
MHYRVRYRVAPALGARDAASRRSRNDPYDACLKEIADGERCN